MDNARYRSRIKDKVPTSGSTKGDMQSWLRVRGVPFPGDLRKPELYQLVKMHKPPLPKYVIDAKAAEIGFNVIRLPPYHCQHNPIEMVWSYLKAYVKERNKTFKMKDVEKHFLEAVSTVTPEMWVKYVNHAKKLMDEDWSSEGLNDRSVQELIINLCLGDSDEDSDFDEDTDEDIGCSPLQ